MDYLSDFKITLGKTIIQVVPSYHYKSIFGQLVNNLCIANNFDCIAVELPHQAIVTIKALLIKHKNKLPFMLGVIYENHLVDSSLLNTMEKLQETFECPIEKIDKEVLENYLGEGNEVFQIQPNDSIIEAIRSSIECKKPVFGIDIIIPVQKYIHEKIVFEEVPDDINKVNSYLIRITKSLNFENKLDYLREHAMAAGLKKLSMYYKNILFVCGAAHFKNIKNLLSDEKVEPYTVWNLNQIKGEIKTVIIPKDKIFFMDTFPSLLFNYEKNRRKLNDTDLVLEKNKHYKIFCNDLNNYEDLNQVILYFKLLKRNTELSIENVPSFLTLISTAKIISTNFCSFVIELLFKDLSFISSCKEFNYPELESKKLHKKSNEDEELKEKSWFISESSTYALGYLAFLQSFKNEKESKRLSSRICIKGTLNSQLKEKYSIVFKPSSGINQAIEQYGRNPEPTVIFYENWRTYKNLIFFEPTTFFCSVGEYIHSYTSEKQKQYFENNKTFIASIHQSEFKKPPKIIKDFADVIYCSQISVLFGDPCFNSRSAYQYLEENNFACLPNCRHNYFSLRSYMKEKHGIELSGKFQVDALRLTLPYIKKRLIIIAPTDFKIKDEYFLDQIQLRGKKFSVVNLSYFDKDLVERGRNRISVSSPNGIVFPKELRDIIEKYDEDDRLLPPYFILKKNLKPKVYL